MPVVRIVCAVSTAQTLEVAGRPVQALQLRPLALAFGRQEVAIADFKCHQLRDNGIQVLPVLTRRVPRAGGAARTNPSARVISWRTRCFFSCCSATPFQSSPRIAKPSRSVSWRHSANRRIRSAFAFIAGRVFQERAERAANGSGPAGEPLAGAALCSTHPARSRAGGSCRGCHRAFFACCSA